MSTEEIMALSLVPLGMIAAAVMVMKRNPNSPKNKFREELRNLNKERKTLAQRIDSARAMYLAYKDPDMAQVVSLLEMESSQLDGMYNKAIEVYEMTFEEKFKG